jgi:uncharacterized cupin superfamily protein
MDPEPTSTNHMAALEDAIRRTRPAVGEPATLPSLGVDVSAIERYQHLVYEAYVDPRSGKTTGERCWLDTTDLRIRAGVWRIEAGEYTAPVAFRGRERFQILDGYAEVVVNGVVLMQVGPGDVGFVREAATAEWWLSPPFAKFFVLEEGEACERLLGVDR